jgi:hypothetical protein
VIKHSIFETDENKRDKRDDSNVTTNVNYVIVLPQSSSNSTWNAHGTTRFELDIQKTSAKYNVASGEVNVGLLFSFGHVWNLFLVSKNVMLDEQQRKNKRIKIHLKKNPNKPQCCH